MIYIYLKIFHIIGAAGFVTLFAYCVYLWRRNTACVDAIDSIQTYTWSVMVPLALFQLTTGFTMMSLKHYGLSEVWVKGSVIGFIVIVSSWVAFMYLMTGKKISTRSKYYWQVALLSIFTIALLSMIFLMANKI